MKLSKISKALRKNFFIPLFLVGILFVGIFLVGKSVFSQPSYVYVKVKVGQGLWWASTAKPNIWYASSIKKGDIKYGLSGKPEVEVLSVRHYPSPTPNWVSNQYDVYVTLKIVASGNKKTGEYSYNRSALMVGSPISLQFPQVDLTGTVTDISANPIEEKYIAKTIYLIYQGGFNKDFSYRYDNIRIGSKYNDGVEDVVEVLEKNLEKNIWPVANNLTGEIYEREIESTQNIVVKVKVKLKETPEGLFYGEDYKITSNASVPFSTEDYFFENFQIRKIE